MANVTQNQMSSRQPSASKRYSEPAVGGATAYQNPWDDNKRVSLAEVNGRKKSTLVGGIKNIGRGLNRKLYLYIISLPSLKDISVLMFD